MPEVQREDQVIRVTGKCTFECVVCGRKAEFAWDGDVATLFRLAESVGWRRGRGGQWYCLAHPRLQLVAGGT